MFMNPSMSHCPEFLRLLTHATFFEAAIARRMSLSDVVHWAELHVQLRIRTAFAVALSKFWWPPVFPYDQQGLTSQFLKPWDLMDKMLEGSLWMRSSLTEINGSWPVLVGLLDSFWCQEQIYRHSWGLASGGFASGLFGTSFGGSSEQAHKWCWGAGSQHCYRSSWWRLWQCNLNGDKLDFRVVNPVFSGDFIARILDSGTEQSVQQQ